MKYKIIVTDDAEFDIEEAMDWYESKQSGLGKRYLLSITNCLKLIVRNPFAYAVIFLKIRKVNTEKFPYSIYFQVIEKQIIVFAVIHSSRSDKHWKQRVIE